VNPSATPSFKAHLHLPLTAAVTPEQIVLSHESLMALSGDYQPGTGASDFAVVWVYGFGSVRGGEKAAAVRAECGRRGWAFAAFDFRGHGQSGGAMHELRASGLLEDLAVVRDFLMSRGHARLGLVGSSMGGLAAAWFAREHPEAVVGCVLQ